MQRRHQCFASGEIGDRLKRVEIRVRTECIGCRLHGIGFARRIGAKRVLHAIAELRQNGFRHIERILRHEINADTLGADQAHHLFDTVDQSLRRFIEEKMGFIEEEDQPRLIGIADFRQFLEEFRHQPKQESGIEPRAHHQLVGSKHAHYTAPVGRGAHQV